LLCTTYFGVRIGDLLSIEGRAIHKAFQGRGLGTTALYEVLANTDIFAAASVTRNPAVPKLMSKAFRVVSPDLGAPDPLHAFHSSPLVYDVTDFYAQHIGANPAETPLVRGRYGEGLYGLDDPGQGMTALPEVQLNPGDGIIMVAIERREDI